MLDCARSQCAVRHLSSSGWRQGREHASLAKDTVPVLAQLLDNDILRAGTPERYGGCGSSSNGHEHDELSRAPRLNGLGASRYQNAVQPVNPSSTRLEAGLKCRSVVGEPTHEVGEPRPARDNRLREPGDVWLRLCRGCSIRLG